MDKKNKQTKVFIVEDDPIYVKLIQYVFELDPDFEIHILNSGKALLKNLHLNPHIISLDYRLPDMNGKDLLKKILAFNKDIGVIILSGQKDISIAVELLKEGASDYVVKNDETKNHLLHAIKRLKSNISLKKEVQELKEELVSKYAIDTLIGVSPKMQEVIKLIQRAVKTNISVSITGETGTGKEIAARSIHFNSNRRKHNFVAINVSAIPKNLIESELFGHEKGAFTGAVSRKLGTFELADKGTLFLDEIAELDFTLQSKLLRALQEREIQRIGGQSPVPFDSRIIVATHKDLKSEVEAGRFREDLFYRLLGLPIFMPPLRERQHDIPLLTNEFLNRFTKENNLGAFKITSGAKEKLLEYAFPGNVRELKAIIELAAVMSENNEITANEIRFNSPKKNQSFLTEELSLKDYNYKIISYFLEKYDNNVLKVAAKLDIGKSTIYRMLKENKMPIEISNHRIL